MTLKNTDARWGAVSQLFHWVIVVLILVMAYLGLTMGCLLYTSPSPRDKRQSRMPSSA